MTTATDQLIQASTQLQQTIGESINWLTQYAPAEKRDTSLDELGKCRRAALRFERAARLRPTIALYGQSQVGKSYLVSNLVRKPNETLLAIDAVGMSDQTVRSITGHGLPISFIDDINPPGGGAESTGIVTRFTTDFGDADGAYRLKLFSQADVVKVLAKGYFSVIKDSPFPQTINDDVLAGLVQQLIDRQLPTLQPGLTADDVLDIRDFLQRDFSNNALVEKLRSARFWEQVAPVLPLVAPDKRGAAFELLWGRQPFLTTLFNQLTGGLQDLGFADEIRVGLDVVAPRSNTVVDVARLSEINNSADVVNVQGTGGKSARINRGVLSALTAELVLPIPKAVAQDPARQFLQTADVLDFPGARGMDEIREDVFVKNTDAEKMSVFLRGKIAYLFATYNDAFAISSLLLCMHNMQIEAQSIPGTVADWIRDKIGNSADTRESREQELARLVPAEVRQRAHRLNPFFLVLTKINIEINGSDFTKGSDPQQHIPKWNTRLKKNFSDAMQKVTNDKWPDKWNLSDGSFKNTYLIRDPSPIFSEPGYEQTPDGREQQSTRFEPVFRGLEESFMANEYVRQHFYEPARAWSESINPGKSGINYLIDNLTPTSHPIIKQEQIRGALEKLRERIGQELCKHYEGGSLEDKLARARARAGQTLMPLVSLVRTKKVGLFLAGLTLSEPFLTRSDSMPWDLAICRQVMNEPANTSAAVAINPAMAPAAPLKTQAQLDDEAILRSLGMLPPEPATVVSTAVVSVETPAVPSAPPVADRYAERLLSRWIDELNDLRHDSRWLRSMDLTEEIAATLTDELVQSMTRSRLKHHIVSAVSPYISQEANAEIVVSLSRALVNDFVNTVGWNMVGADVKRRNNAVVKADDGQDQPIFTYSIRPTMLKHQLKLNVDDPGRAYKLAWLQGTQRSFEYNVLAEAGVSDPRQAAINAQMERLIKQLDYTCH